MTKICNCTIKDVKEKIEKAQEQLAKAIRDEVMKDEPSIEYNEDELVGYIMRKTSSINLTYEEVRAVLDAELDFLATKGITEHGGGAKNER